MREPPLTVSPNDGTRESGSGSAFCTADFGQIGDLTFSEIVSII
jgi:hypothetical protein